jgi:hypothetical protein
MTFLGDCEESFVIVACLTHYCNLFEVVLVLLSIYT